MCVCVLVLGGKERNVCKQMDSLQWARAEAEVILSAEASEEQSREREALLGIFSINTFRWRIMG